MKIKLKDIRPNPFIDTKRPPEPSRVKRLVESMEATDFWGGLVARQQGDTYEAAFGRHRLEALLQKHGLDEEIDVTVRELSDETMLRMYLDENDEAWDTSARRELETLSVVLRAIGSGKVSLPPPSPKTPKSEIRYAPSAARDVSDPERRHPYTAGTLAKYLGSGWNQDKISDLLAALERIEKGEINESQFEGLTSKQIAAVVKTMRTAAKVSKVMVTKAKDGAEKAALDAVDAESRVRQAEEEEQRLAAQAREASTATKKIKAKAKAKEAALLAKAARRKVAEALGRHRSLKQAAKNMERAASSKGADAAGRVIKSMKAKGEDRLGYRRAAERSQENQEPTKYISRLLSEVEKFLALGRLVPMQLRTPVRDLRKLLKKALVS